MLHDKQINYKAHLQAYSNDNCNNNGIELDENIIINKLNVWFEQWNQMCKIVNT